jgi:SAM-dependent methyltransferase
MWLTWSAQRDYRPCVDDRTRQVAAVFDLVSRQYDDVGVPWFGPVAAALVDAVAPATGEAVLDVGCGKGAATFHLADRVSPGGTVLGLDASEGMLEQARRIAAERGRTDIEWVFGDAMAPGLPPSSFDAIASSLVLFFLPDPVVALGAWHALLRTGGRVGVTTFGGFDPAVDALGSLLDPYLPGGAVDARAPVQPDWFDSDGGVAGLFAAAGFGEVSTHHATVSVRLRDVEHWREWSQSLGQRAAWERIPSALRPELLARAADIFAEYAQSDGTVLAHNDIRITIARA